jgi:PKD repeat protein
VKCKTTDAFEPAGQPNPGDRIGASATADFRDVVVIGDDKTTVANEGGQAGGNKVRFTVDITNTSTSSDIRLTSFNFQTKQRGLTDINELDGTSILGRQDLRTGADGDRTLVPECGDDPMEAKCFDPTLGIGRFPNVLGNSLLSSTFAGPEPNDLDPHFEPGLAGVPGKLEAIKKNGTFQPLTRTDLGVANYICIKSGAPAPDQDADETCSGSADSGLLPGETQSVRLEMDYGDFRGLILRVAPGTLQDYVSPADDPFGLIALRGDFDCRDQRRLPYCHPDLVGDDWFTSPTSLEDVEFVTVHQPGEAATVMNFTDNFGELLAMAGFAPTAEFWQGSTQVQVRGEYLNLPGRDEGFITVSVTSPSAGSTVTGTVDVEASTAGSATPDQVEFFAQLDDGTPTSIGVDTDVSDGWSTTWDTDGGGFADGGYTLTAVATAGTLNATSSGVTVTLANGLTVDIVQPADQAVVTGETTLAAKTFGLVDADGVTFAYRKAGSTGTPIAIGPGALTSGQWEVVWDTTTVPADRYEVIATATNEAETATDSIVVEVVQLSVKIVAPDDGAVLFKTVPLKAEVISALPVTSVEFFYDAAPDPFNGIDDPPVSAGEATFKPDTGLWEVDWNTRAVDDTPLTKPRTQDTLGVVVTTAGGTAGDAIDVRVTNMLTTRIFLPDNQEDLLGRTDLEALLTGQSDITSVRFDLYDLADLDPEIFRPFGEASSDGSPIVDFKYGRPLGNPEYPTGSPVHQIGPASPEGASRWVIRNWDTRTVPDGTYGLVARATDSEGRKASYMIETYIVNDLTVDITSPSAGDKVGPYVALQARTGGLFPVTSVVFTAGEDTVPATESPAGSGRWKAVWDATGKANGSYDITATATNTAAKTATDTVTVTVQNGSGGTLEAFFPYDWSNCEELTCSFVDGSKGGATSWSWDFGDTVSGDTSTLQVPDAYEYSAPGVYTVTLTVDNGTATDEYTRTIPVGNIGIDGFNTNPINDAGTETITWTSALKDFTYTVGDEIFVPVHWKTTLGTATFDSLPEAVLFTPEEADGTDPELVGIADEGMLFKITFTEVQFRGGTGIFKGKVNLGINVDVDYGNGGSAVDWEARLGTNVDVTNSGTIDPGNFLHVWVTEPDAGAVLTGTQTLAATPLASGTVSGVEFFANGTKIGDATKTDTSRPDGGRWTLDWETPSLPGGEYVLVAAARGGGLEARSTGITVTVQNTTPAPTVTLTADPTTVISGGSSTLTWTTTNATACTATGGGGTWYNGSLPGGSASTGALTATTTYSLTCTGPGGTSEPASTTVTVPAPPTLTFSAASSTVEYNQGTTLTWSATNATSCTASGDWGGSKSTTGSESTGPLTAAKTYTLACTGDGGSVSKTVQVMVEPTFTGSATKQRGGWSATVSVTGAQPSTTISGTWSVGGTPNSCNTNGSGTCNFTRTGLKNNLSSVTWTHTASGKKVTINRP